MIRTLSCLMFVVATCGFFSADQAHAQDRQFMKIEVDGYGTGATAEAAKDKAMDNLKKEVKRQVEWITDVMDRWGFRVVKVLYGEPQVYGPFQQPDGSFACLVIQTVIIVYEPDEGGGGTGGDPVGNQ